MNPTKNRARSDVFRAFVKPRSRRDVYQKDINYQKGKLLFGTLWACVDMCLGGCRRLYGADS